MKILSYECQSFEPKAWHFSRVSFGKINLLVGDTATGKTRLLNTIFNLGRFVAADEFRVGMWDITFEQDGGTYRWLLETDKKDKAIVKDYIWRIKDGEEVPIVKRDGKSFIFNDKDMPKLPKKENSVWLLKEEDLIRPIHEGFSNILRRRFHQEALMDVSAYETIPPGLIEKMKKERNLKTLFLLNLNLNGNLFFLSQHFKDIFDKICTSYKAVFPFVTETQILDVRELDKNISIPGVVPVFCVKERKLDEWIQLKDLSSGMQKVLLILADIFVLPKGGIYVIDEYENSLGINAIDFFPAFIMDVEKDIQFFVTSHHPYIINKIPVDNWYIFHRRGSQVSIKHGQELIKRFGKSKQKAFIKLINDPFYTEGVE